MAVSRDTVKELRGQRLQLANQRGELIDLAERAGRDLTGEEKERFDRWNADDVALEQRIARAEGELDRQEKLHASAGVIAGRSDSADDDDGVTAKPREKGQREGFLGAWARWRALKANQRAAYVKANGLEGRNIEALSDANIGSNGFAVEVDEGGEARALSALSDTAGAYTIEPELETSVISAVLSWGGLLRAPVNKFTTSTGVDINYILDNDTTNEGEWIAENTAVAQQDVAFSRKTLKSYTISSKLILVPLELLQDTAINLEAYLNERFAIRIGRTLNTGATTGNGVGKATGIVTSATTGVTAVGTGSVTWQELLGLKHSVDPDYRSLPSVGWMFNDTTLLAIKSMVDGFGRPLWQPSVIVGEPPTIDGDKYYVNQSMASMATGTKPVIYGAFQYYYLRSVAGVSFVRLVERYAESRQIGFFAFQRHDGLLMNPGGTNNPVKCLLMA